SGSRRSTAAATPARTRWTHRPASIPRRRWSSGDPRKYGGSLAAATVVSAGARRARACWWHVGARRGAAEPGGGRAEPAGVWGGPLVPRPEVNLITFTLDGREVEAPEGLMLVDAAKYGDVEIPVFCYEPKLGQPVGACRMCLVEVEGIPKLQTGCSTPVKDGMVVHTQTDRVHQAQRAVVEFLLINHPLDCPVCDKGGECPLQDITYGWGPGTPRFI